MHYFCITDTFYKLLIFIIGFQLCDIKEKSKHHLVVSHSYPGKLIVSYTSQVT
jgi:hypothetical protein